MRKKYPNFVLKDTAILAKAGELEDWCTSAFSDVFDDEAIDAIKNRSLGSKKSNVDNTKSQQRKKKGKKNDLTIEVGSEVIHKTYGSGIITSLSSGKIEVKFMKDGTIKKFPYPAIFEEGLIQKL